MAEQARTQKTQKLESVENVVFGDVTASFRTSLAYDKEHRKEGDTYDINLKVNLAGVPLKDALKDFLAQCAIKFQRTRRASDSNGVFNSVEAFNEYVESLGGEAELHYSNVGKAPQKPLSDAQAEAELEQLMSQMSPEAKERFLRKKAEG